MTEEIRSNIYRIPVPLPGSPLKNLNAYCIVGKDRHLLVDTGFNRPECLEALTSALDSLGVDRRKLDICVTHLHADHSGLASDLLEGPDSVMLCSARDGASINGLVDMAEHQERLASWMNPHGFNAAEVEEMCATHPAVRFRPSRVVDFRPIGDGDVLQYGGYQLRVINVPGHTPGHIALYEPEHKLFFAADHILGDITPNITRWPDVADSLGDYLNSLEAVRKLDIALTLPGHRSLVHDTQGRIQQLLDHHARRLDEVRRILVAGEANGYTVASQMTWEMRYASWQDFPAAQKWFATGEALSHLDRLVALGEAREEVRDGRSFFQAVAQA